MKKEIWKTFLWVANVLLVGLIVGLPMIALNVEDEIIGIILMIVDGILINVYGTLYFKLNKYIIGEHMFKLKIHQYTDGKIWIESNDIIDGVIETEIVEHNYRKIE